MGSNLTPQDVQQNKFANELAPGTTLLHGQYVIEEFLNNGGFGITYLAKDSLHRLVVIKECFPETICRRSEATVKVRSRDQAETYRAIVDLFIEEARNLARLSHPHIVGVHQVFEDNDTAYMAMDFVEGHDLMVFADGSETIEPAALEGILVKLLDAVEFMHKEGILHRDISPDNILLGKNNEPVLIDFGAARETVSNKHSYLASLRTVKDGYSPQEFYVTTSDQHPSSDLYSLAASLYHVMCKELPVGAQTRMTAIASGEDDPYIPIKDRVSGYSETFLEAIDLALMVFPKDRIQSAAEWKAILAGRGGTASRPVLAVEDGNILEQFAKGAMAKARSRTSVPRTILEGAASQAGAAVSRTLDPLATAAASSAKVASKSGLNMGVAAAALLVLVGAGAFFMMGDGDAPVAVTPEVATTASVVPAPNVAEPEEQVAEVAPETTAGEATKPEQVPFFLAGRSEGDVTVSSANGTLSTRTVTASDDGSRQSAQPTRETATDATPVAPSDPSPAPTVEIAEVDASSLVSAKAIRFPVESDSVDPALVAAVSGPMAGQIEPGHRIVSVNGFPIEALSDFQRVVDATADYSVGDAVSVDFGVENTSTGSRDVRTIELSAVQRTILPNGVVFETTREDGNWATIVAQGSGEEQTDLRPGDRVVALMPSNERIEGEDAIAEVLRRELDDGVTQFNFAVTRDGEMWLAQMRYADAPSN